MTAEQVQLHAQSAYAAALNQHPKSSDRGNLVNTHKNYDLLTSMESVDH
jgi:hypothetical protein